MFLPSTERGTPAFGCAASDGETGAAPVMVLRPATCAQPEVDPGIRSPPHKLAHPGRIYVIAAGSECKIALEDLQSERHPDLAIYKTLPPEESDDFWSIWIPELVIEIVSPGSELRDYQEKREEYLAFGVREYWIFDADKEEMLVLQRVGRRWRERIVRPPDVYKTRLFPGLQFSCERVFQAAKAVEK